MAPVEARAARFGTRRDHLWAVVLAAAASVAALLWYRSLDLIEFRRSGQLWLGWASAAGYGSAIVYSARKRLGFLRFRPLRPWYVAHVWLTAAGFGVGLLHAGFRLGGLVERLLLIGFGVTLASGFLLAAVQDRFKAWILRLEGDHLLPEDIVDARARLATEAAELLAANRDELRAVVDSGVLGPLKGRGPLLVCLKGREQAEALKGRLEKAMAGAVKALKKEEQEVVARILSHEVERKKLEAQALLHALRTAMTTFHLALSSAVFALLLLHVGLVAWY